MLHVIRALELCIGLRVELQGEDPDACALRAPFTAWPIYCVGRTLAKPLVELYTELQGCKSINEASILS